MSYTIQAPHVTAAVLSPNPALQNATLSLSITITEKTITLEPYHYYSGDLYAGEDS